MHPEQVQGLIDFIPSSKEKVALRQYLSNLSQKDYAAKLQGLCECEKFMVAMMDVDQPVPKVSSSTQRLDGASQWGGLKHRNEFGGEMCQDSGYSHSHMLVLCHNLGSFR